MSVAANGPVSDGAEDRVLTDLVDALARKVQAGEPVDVEAAIRAHPRFTDRLRQLLPAVQLLADLGRSAASGESSVPAGDRPGPEGGRLGDFRLLREIGRGGMGVVYEAEQISLRRRVALKVLPLAAALDWKHLHRFKQEAQAAAHLLHQNIVAIHAVGTDRGVHYYAMQLIDGQTLAALIAELRQQEGLAPVALPPTVPAAADPDTRPVAALSTEGLTFGRAFFRAAADLGEQAAEALEHAHQMGVVHRDVK